MAYEHHITNAATGETIIVPFTPEEIAAAEEAAANAPGPILRPELFAIGQVKTDGVEVSSIAISAALSGAFLLDTGELWCFFSEAQADTEYIVLAYDSNSVRAFVNDEDKFTEYFVIRITDFDGVPTNPSSINFEVKRVA